MKVAVVKVVAMFDAVVPSFTVPCVLSVAGAAAMASVLRFRLHMCIS